MRRADPQLVIIVVCAAVFAAVQIAVSVPPSVIAGAMFALSAIYMVAGFRAYLLSKAMRVQAHMLADTAYRWFDVVASADLADAQVRHDANALRDGAQRAIDQIEAVR